MFFKESQSFTSHGREPKGIINLKGAWPDDNSALSLALRAVAKWILSDRSTRVHAYASLHLGVGKRLLQSRVGETRLISNLLIET